MRLHQHFGFPIHRGLIAICGIVAIFLATATPAQDAKPFTLQQVLSAPFASQLAAAPVGNLFAWVEDAEGRHNLWVGGKDVPARQLTHYTEDDGQDITRLAWSPDANAIAYTYGASNGADGKPANPAHLQRPTPVRVIVQPLAPDATPIIIGDGRSPLFEPLNHHLLFLREGQIWSADLDVKCSSATGCSFEVSPKSVHQLVFDRGSASSLTLSPDGNTLAFISRRREANEPSHSLLALYNLRTHTLTFPAASTGDDSAPAFSPDGKQLAWLRAPFTDTPEFALNRTSPNPWSIQLLDLTAGTTRTAYSPEPNKPGSVLPLPDDAAPDLLWSADNHIIFYSEADGWDHLYSLDLSSSKQPVLLTPGHMEAEGAVLSPNRNLIVFSASGPTTVNRPLHDSAYSHGPVPFPENADRRGLWKVDLSVPSPTAVPIEPTSEVETSPKFASNGQLVALVSNYWSPTHPEKMDLNEPSGDGHISFYLRGGFITADFQRAVKVKPVQVLFNSPLAKDTTDNIQIHGQLFLSTNLDPKVKHPAILFMHGGPRRQMLLGYPAMEYYSNAYAMNQYLTSRGFIVLSVNYRCGIGYGLDFRQCADEGATGAKEYEDILAAQRYLASRSDVDAKRIGLWGGSYGGYLTALGLARNSDLFAAGVDFHGVHDWNLEDNASDWKRGNNAEQDAIGKLALASSPLADISKWRSPILLIHGDNDPSVAYAQTPLLADALRARNSHLPKDQQVDVEELIFPDEVHEFLLHRDWLAAYTAAAAFFERTLKPEAVK